LNRIITTGGYEYLRRINAQVIGNQSLQAIRFLIAAEKIRSAGGQFVQQSKRRTDALVAVEFQIGRRRRFRRRIHIELLDECRRSRTACFRESHASSSVKTPIDRAR
jgi:hypothetical protein